MIRYFREGLRPSVRAQLDAQGGDLDSWEEAVKKAVNAKAKALLQSFFSTRDMDSRCFRGNRLAKKEEKDSSRKNKSNNSAPADIFNEKQSFSTQQTFSAHPKKDQRGGFWRRKGQCQDSLATGVNVIPKKEEVDLSQVNCYYCRKKGIMLIGVLRRENKSQKTSIGLRDFYVND